jgi:hypothetical protein
MAFSFLCSNLKGIQFFKKLITIHLLLITKDRYIHPFIFFIIKNLIGILASLLITGILFLTDCPKYYPTYDTTTSSTSVS